MELLYSLTLLPIEWVMQLILEWAFNHTQSYGYSLIILSIVVNIFLLPIYYQAENWRNQDKLIQAKMRSMIDNIKRNYKGKERHYYIQALYRLHGYTPVSSVKASAGFLIQIPFFFAAFHLLGNYEALNGSTFFIFQDLGQPDGLLFGINLLPFLMTVVNLVSAYTYIRNYDTKEKYQLWGMAILFLVILYIEPAGLLIYWTVNNVFSLFKNIVERYVKVEIKIWNKLKGRVKISDTPKFSEPKVSSNSLVQFLYDCLVSLILLLVLANVAVKFLPQGINLLLAEKSIKVYWQLSILTFVILFIATRIRAQSIVVFKGKTERVTNKDFVLLLLPLGLVFQYVVYNFEMLTQLEMLNFILKSILFSAVFVLLIPYVMSIFSTKKLITSVTTSYLFILFFMPTFVSIRHWSQEGTFEILMISLFLLMIVMYLLYAKNERLLSILVILFFILNVSNSIVTKEATIRQEQGSKVDNSVFENQKNILKIISNNPLKKNNDIILLVYDAYVTQETLSYYGIDNSEQTHYLSDLGFKIYEKNYTIAVTSLPSMSRTLDIALDVNKTSRIITSGDSFIVNLLRDYAGYRSIGIFNNDYFLRRIKPKWDVAFPEYDTRTKPFNLFSATLSGEFRFDFGMEGFEYKDFLNKKNNILSSREYSPYFMYMHTDFPGHAQISGKCFPNEIDLFQERLQKANEEMRVDLDTLLANNPNAIVIVAGDHGPYLTKNCSHLQKYPTNQINRYDIQDRYGAFLAIKWPKGFKNNYHLETFQDVFPAVLANLFENENIWKQGRVNNRTIGDNAGPGIYVEDGIIHGGIHEGKPLFQGVSETEFGGLNKTQ